MLFMISSMAVGAGSGTVRTSYPSGSLNNAGSGVARSTSDSSLIIFAHARIVKNVAHEDSEIGRYPKLSHLREFLFVAVTVGRE
jgi:hypothetical protein